MADGPGREARGPMVWRFPLPKGRSRAWAAAGAASVLAALGSSCAIQGRRPPTPDAATQAFARPAIEALSTEQALTELAAYEEGKSNRALLAIEARVARGPADGEAYGQLLDRLAALLADPGVRVAAKRFVCRQLSVGGCDRHVTAVAALLNDPELSHMARYALGRMPGPAAGEALRAALDTVRGPLLVGGCQHLGRAGRGPGSGPPRDAAG
jgi:hypothetical protein